MNCPTCGGPRTLLFTTYVCDRCEPPAGSNRLADPRITVSEFRTGLEFEVLYPHTNYAGVDLTQLWVQLNADHLVMHDKKTDSYCLFGPDNLLLATVIRNSVPRLESLFKKYSQWNSVTGNVLYLRTVLETKIFVS